MKDFDTWNVLQKKLDAEARRPYVKIRQIWWCSFGVNIGSEQDGKNSLFERPALILQVFSARIVCIVPLTGKCIDKEYYFSMDVAGYHSSAIVSQIKTVDTKRFTRKIGTLDTAQFGRLMHKVKHQFK